ncbi:MAG: 50S ribosomal protein L11 methyltransferase, partial [Shimia sp.]
AALERLDPAPTGVGVFEMEDGSGLWEVGAYFLDAPAPGDVALLEAAFDVRLAVSEVPDIDWVAKVRRELVPVPAGRFWVHGGHDADAVPDGVEPLLIEAAMAFGTGHHGTTQGCLEAFDALLSQGRRFDRVADIGCGTAVLAMAAARTTAAAILATDIDPVAVEVAEANVMANGLAGRVTCRTATGFEHPEIAALRPFDLIFANILKGPLVGLAPELVAHLAPGGIAILSGLLNDQADEVADAYAAAGAGERARRAVGDWTTLTLARDV